MAPDSTQETPEHTDPNGFGGDQPSYPPPGMARRDGIYIPKAWVGIGSTLLTAALIGGFGFIWQNRVSLTEMRLSYDVRFTMVEQNLIHIQESVDRIEREVTK